MALVRIDKIISCIFVGLVYQTKSKFFLYENLYFRKFYKRDLLNKSRQWEEDWKCMQIKSINYRLKANKSNDRINQQVQAKVFDRTIQSRNRNFRLQSDSMFNVSLVLTRMEILSTIYNNSVLGSYIINKKLFLTDL